MHVLLLADATYVTLKNIEETTWSRFPGEINRIEAFQVSGNF